MHHGSRLKKLVEKSSKKVVDILSESGVTKSTLYNFFDYEDIPRKKIKPILDVIGVKIDHFYKEKLDESQLNNGGAHYGLVAHIEELEKRIALLEKMVANKDEMIELLKKSKR